MAQWKEGTVGTEKLSYKIELGEITVWCADTHAAAKLIRELQDTRRAPRPKRDQARATTAKKAILEEPYRTAVSTLVAHHPEGIYGDVFVTKTGFEDNPKGFGGFMTGLRKQLSLAGLPDAITRERKKNGTWRNHFRLDDRVAETLKKWLNS